MVLHHGFDLVGKHVEARHQNHVFLAIDDAGVTVVIHDADVTALEVTVSGHDLGGFIRALPVARHHLRTADGNFTGLAIGDRVAIIVEDDDFGRRQRHADGAAERGGRCRIAGCRRRGFTEAVAFDDRATGQLEPFARHCFLNGHAATVGDAQLREIQLAKLGAVDQRVIERINRREMGNLERRNFLDQRG